MANERLFTQHSQKKNGFFLKIFNYLYLIQLHKLLFINRIKSCCKYIYYIQFKLNQPDTSHSGI